MGGKIYYYPYRAFGGQNKIVYSRFVTRRAIFFLILAGQYFFNIARTLCDQSCNIDLRLRYVVRIHSSELLLLRPTSFRFRAMAILLTSLAIYSCIPLKAIQYYIIIYKRKLKVKLIPFLNMKYIKFILKWKIPKMGCKRFGVYKRRILTVAIWLHAQVFVYTSSLNFT